MKKMYLIGLLLSSLKNNNLFCYGIFVMHMLLILYHMFVCVLISNNFNKFKQYFALIVDEYISANENLLDKIALIHG